MTESEVQVAQMCEAILKRDAQEVDRLLAAGVDPNANDNDYPTAWNVIRRTRNGSTLLHEAVMWNASLRRRPNDPTVARLLIEAGADVSACTDDGFQPLHGASLANNVSSIRLLINAGANINAQSAKGHTPLHTAVYYDSAEAVELLLLHGARLDMKLLNGETPAAYAGRLNHPRVRSVLTAALARSTLKSLCDGDPVCPAPDPEKTSVPNPAFAFDAPRLHLRR